MFFLCFFFTQTFFFLISFSFKTLKLVPTATKFVDLFLPLITYHLLNNKQQPYRATWVNGYLPKEKMSFQLGSSHG